MRSHYSDILPIYTYTQFIESSCAHVRCTTTDYIKQYILLIFLKKINVVLLPKKVMTDTTI